MWSRQVSTLLSSASYLSVPSVWAGRQQASLSLTASLGWGLSQKGCSMLSARVGLVLLCRVGYLDLPVEP